MRGLLALLAGVALAAAGYVVAAAPSALLADGTTPTPTSTAASTVTTTPSSTTTAPTTSTATTTTTTSTATTTTTTTSTAVATTAPATTATTTTTTTFTPRPPKPPPPAYVVVQPAVIPTAATVGTTLTYSVALKNTGKTGSGMTVVNTLSASVALIAADADQSGSCSGAAPQVTCSWDALAPNQAANATIVVQVIQPGDVTTTVDARASDPAATVESRPAPPPVTAVQAIPIRFVAPGH